jgi:8-oxo-dGTP pyrophosphatase MutT (NUDIX family)
MSSINIQPTSSYIDLKPKTLNLLKQNYTNDTKEHHNDDINSSIEHFKQRFGQSPQNLGTFVSQQNIKNKKEIDNEFIHFKKRKPYTYNSYEHFSNPRKMNKYRYNIYDDLYKPSDNYYENIRESKNYPELNIDLSKLSSEYIILLNSQNIKTNIPITSYGIVLYTYEKDKYLKYLVCQRRDSISYIQYLQDLIEEKNILKYINLMSKEEKQRCLEYYYKNDSHSIWKDLWINHKSKIYTNDYNRCTKMFQKNMEKYLEYFKDNSTGQNENQWFFPKGRIHKNENQIDCAIREFEEETNIDSENIYVNKNITFEEYYIGSNNLIYKTVYYIAYIPYIPKKIYKYYPSNIRTKFISSEIYDMEWLEFNDAIQKLDESKKDVLTKINNYILKKKKF